MTTFQIIRVDLTETYAEQKYLGFAVKSIARKCWEVVNIVDTRMLDSQRKPISGSGESVPCECCGRTIEVHAAVVNRVTGHEATVGTQCCKKAGFDYRGVSPTNKAFWKSLGRRLA